VRLIVYLFFTQRLLPALPLCHKKKKQKKEKADKNEEKKKKNSCCVLGLDGSRRL